MSAFTFDDIKIIKTFNLNGFFELEEDHIYSPSGDKLMKDEEGFTVLLIDSENESTHYEDLHNALQAFHDLDK